MGNKLHNMAESAKVEYLELYIYLQYMYVPLIFFFFHCLLSWQVTG